MSGTGLVGLAEIRDAARGLEGVAVRTPLIPVAGLEPPLLVKPESLQPTGSFKLRGAYTAITASEQAARRYGVVAHSSGNHGHAVAYAAALLGVRAVVVVPRTAPKVKTDAIERYGAELVRVEPTLPARRGRGRAAGGGRGGGRGCGGGGAGRAGGRGGGGGGGLMCRAWGRWCEC